MFVIKAKIGLPVPLGRVGENKARKIMFPVDDVLRDHPSATFMLLNRREGDIAAYPVAPEEITVSGGYLNWIPTSADLSKQGDGKCEMVATENGVICKDIIYDTTVEEALDESGEAPDPWKSWQQQVKEDADRAEAAAELLEHPVAEATTLDAGEDATAAYSDGTFSFGIPRGADGISPVISVEEIPGGHEVSVTDKIGTETFDVMDGEDGFSPTATVEKVGNTATITITDKDGTTTATVKDGEPADVIDDTAGAGDTDKAWSADKLVGEFSGKIDATEKGAANGVAELDSGGKVPASQLPGFVDDVVEYASASVFPATGESGKIYVALDTNKTYRWSGSAYVEISASLALGETDGTAYRGDRGAAAYAAAVTNVDSNPTSGSNNLVTSGGVFAAVSEKYTKPADGIPDTDMASTVQTSLGLADTAYQKPAAGIPAEDIADGVIPDPEDLIDDTAGSGDTDKVWSADKLTGQIDLLAPKANPVFTGSISLSRVGSTTGSKSIAVGNMVTASGQNSAAFGNGTTASGANSHSEGQYTYATGANAHAEGYGSAGSTTYGARGKADHAEGYRTTANSGSTSTYYGAHAEGHSTSATNDAAHSEGLSTTASGQGAHAEGYYSTASGSFSHAEGHNTKANASYSHSEGMSSIASGSKSHAEGSSTASGEYSHSEGNGTRAKGYCSHAGGYQTTADVCGIITGQHVFGSYNIPDERYSVTTTAEDGATWEPNKAYKPYFWYFKDPIPGSTSVYVPHNDVPEYPEPIKDVAQQYWHNVSLPEGTDPETVPVWDKDTLYPVNTLVKELIFNGTYMFFMNHNAVETTYIPLTATNYYHSQPIGSSTSIYPYALEIVGSGKGYYCSRNARKLDDDGNEYLHGDLYVNCNDDSSGGTKVAKITDIPSPTGIIDDTAGSGDTDKVWSADKVTGIVSNLNNEIDGIEASIAPVESTTTATAAHAVGELFMLGETLMVALSAIAVGDTIATTGATPNAAVTKLTEKLIKDVQVNGTSVVQGGVANVPLASHDDAGVIKVYRNNTYGLTINNSGYLQVSGATTQQVKAGASSVQTICPNTQQYAVYYGLSKLAGEDLASDTVTVGTYPEKSKSAISQMLDAPETVSGTTPSITAKAGVRYVCGECATLSITAPASGIIDVTFDSGSTPTVLTVTPPTGMTMRWIGDDPTALEANKHYEINIMDGCNGMVVSWT